MYFPTALFVACVVSLVLLGEPLTVTLAAAAVLTGHRRLAAPKERL